MCGIIGYAGSLDAKSILLSGLSQLEYRGYDSAGIAMFDLDSTIHLFKKTGKVKNLIDHCAEWSKSSHCGIGHTRWATHGEVTDQNAHPHQAGRITLIHNGIIENYHQLVNDYQLTEKLQSQTDSEVAAWVLDHLYDGDVIKTMTKFISLIKGTYGFCIIFADHPEEIYAIRKVSPLVAANTPSGAIIASDLTALIPYTKNYFVLPENHLVKMTTTHLQLLNLTNQLVEPEQLEINWNVDAAMKNGFPHFMLKEIHEQPEALKATIVPRINNGLPDFKADNIPDSIFDTCTRIQIIACGTAIHAGIAAKLLLEPILRLPITVSIASEFRYQKPLLDQNSLVIAISQSGETIDTLAALHLAQLEQAITLSIVNVKGSTIARDSDYVLYTHAGPEIAVASTKAYSVQLAALYMIGCKMAYVRNIYDEAEAKQFITELMEVIPAMKVILTQQEQIKHAVSHLIHQPDAFFIGRGLDYALSLEGALKLKEISYIHAEAYAAGELKHGAIALITSAVPVVAIATQEHVFTKMISNIREVKARGAFVILLTKNNVMIDPNLADIHLTIPDLSDHYTVFPIAIILQLIAYYASLGKQLNVDQPRNLAKSVTVE